MPPTVRAALHFHPAREQGGCVRRASDLAEHVAHLQASSSGRGPSEEIRRFAGDFLRPHGIDRAVAPVLAEAIESAVRQAFARRPSRSPWR